MPAGAGSRRAGNCSPTRCSPPGSWRARAGQPVAAAAASSTRPQQRRDPSRAHVAPAPGTPRRSLRRRHRSRSAGRRPAPNRLPQPAGTCHGTERRGEPALVRLGLDGTRIHRDACGFPDHCARREYHAVRGDGRSQLQREFTDHFARHPPGTQPVDAAQRPVLLAPGARRDRRAGLRRQPVARAQLLVPAQVAHHPGSRQCLAHRIWLAATAQDGGNADSASLPVGRSSGTEAMSAAASSPAIPVVSTWSATPGLRARARTVSRCGAAELSTTSRCRPRAWQCGAISSSTRSVRFAASVEPKNRSNRSGDREWRRRPRRAGRRPAKRAAAGCSGAPSVRWRPPAAGRNSVTPDSANKFWSSSSRSRGGGQQGRPAPAFARRVAAVRTRSGRERVVIHDEPVGRRRPAAALARASPAASPVSPAGGSRSGHRHRAASARCCRPARRTGTVPAPPGGAIRRQDCGSGPRGRRLSGPMRRRGSRPGSRRSQPQRGQRPARGCAGLVTRLRSTSKANCGPEMNVRRHSRRGSSTRRCSHCSPVARIQAGA